MPEALETKTLAELTTEIVAAYVARHQLSATDLPAVLGAVGQRLAALAIGEEPKAAAPAKPEPAVPVQRSVTPEHLICLACGQRNVPVLVICPVCARAERPPVATIRHHA
jgi:predicted transcriptional regulator